MGLNVLIKRQETRALSLCAHRKVYVSKWLEGTSANKDRDFINKQTNKPPWHLVPGLLAYRNVDVGKGFFVETTQSGIHYSSPNTVTQYPKLRLNLTLVFNYG